jgi:hypothetical protein
VPVERQHHVLATEHLREALGEDRWSGTPTHLAELCFSSLFEAFALVTAESLRQGVSEPP